MPKITYVHADNTREEIDVPVGTSVMRGAILNGIDGIVAECGGEMMCATCHVYVEEAQLPLTPAQSDDEKAMLEFTASERKPNSRLSCQLVVTPEMDGLVVHLPEIAGLMAEPVVAVVGAGQGGFQVASSLRQEGFAGRIVLFGDEPGLPYQRPPLSKSYLAGDSGLDELWLRPEAFYEKQRIDYLAGETVAALDRRGGCLRLGSGRELACDWVVLATGARNRPLPVPGADLDGVMGLRTLADADALRQRLAEAREVVVVGAGFIGLEFASVAIASGAAVHILEVTQQPMGRVVSAPISHFFTDGASAMGGDDLARRRGVADFGRQRPRHRGRDIRRPPSSRRSGARLHRGHSQRRTRRRGGSRRRRTASSSTKPRDRRPGDPGDRRLRQLPDPLRRGTGAARIGAERGRPGALRRRPHRRQADALRQGAVVLERPGRPEIADRRARHRPRHSGRARRAGEPQLLGVLLSRWPADRRRIWSTARPITSPPAASSPARPA